MRTTTMKATARTAIASSLADAAKIDAAALVLLSFGWRPIGCGRALAHGLELYPRYSCCCVLEALLYLGTEQKLMIAIKFIVPLVSLIISANTYSTIQTAYSSYSIITKSWKEGTV